MTTAALLQSTSVLTDFTAESAFVMAGAPGGIFDASPTDTVVTVLSATGVGGGLFISAAMTIVTGALAVSGTSPVSWNGVTFVQAAAPGDFIMPGAADVAFVGENAAPPIVLLPVRFIVGPESGVIPVEIVEEAGDDVIDVQVITSQPNYTPVFEDPTHPMRKKIRIVE